MSDINPADFSTSAYTPPRWKVYADYLVTNDPAQLALLDANDEAYYNYVHTSVSPFLAPNVAIGLAAKNVGSLQFLLSTTDNNLPVQYYYTLSSIIPYSGTPPTTPSSATTNFATSTNAYAVIGTITNAGLVAGSDVVVAIQATANVANPPPTVVAAFEAILAPAAPTAILTTPGASQVTITWTLSSGASSYIVYYIGNATGSETAAQIISTGTQFTGTTINTGTIITGITPGNIVNATVTAINPGGTSLGGTPSSATVVTAPAAPTAILVTPASTQATVTWTLSSGATSYSVYYIGNATGLETAAYIIANGTLFVGTVLNTGTIITGLTPGNVINATVTATNTGGTSLGGTPSHASLIPLAPVSILTTPGHLQATVTWNLSAGATSYNVYYIGNATGSETAAYVIANGTHFVGTVINTGTVITGLSTGNIVNVTVTATDSGGTSLGGTPSHATVT
jgi:hypothetical protein